ncbi:hypothetical protein ACET3X_005706 [Alternaria dauci]|uniref:Uncharacterized protein n=1 Tax=Alternaria dauci TaxID=48095 RepID=A0ABR3UGY8_9PLEO
MANMATTDPVTPFRFMDLPRELRNKVYTLLLCSFGKSQDNTQVFRDNFLKDGPDTSGAFIVPRTNDPTILRVNSQIHREAYDVMVKTNRFIRICCPEALPLEEMTCCLGVAVVARKLCAAHFSGHLVDIFMSSAMRPLRKNEDKSCKSELADVVIRATDLKVFCDNFKRAEPYIPELAISLEMVIKVVPMLELERPWYRDDLAGFFSETTQKTILQPLLSLRDIKSVEVHGPVTPKMVAKLRSRMTSDEFEGFDNDFDVMIGMKEIGMKLYQEGSVNDTISIWEDALAKVSRMRQSKVWTKLTNTGGEDEIEKLALLDCSLGLNWIQASIVLWGGCSDVAATPFNVRKRQKLSVEFDLQSVEMCLQKGYWKEGYTWSIPDTLAANYAYRRALCIRIWGDVFEAPMALMFISQALVMAPDDPVVLQEQQNIMRWAGMI